MSNVSNISESSVAYKIIKNRQQNLANIKEN